MIFTILNWFAAIMFNAIGSSANYKDEWGLFIFQLIILLGSFVWIYRLVQKLDKAYYTLFIAVLFLTVGSYEAGTLRHPGPYLVGGYTSLLFGWMLLSPVFDLCKKRDKEREEMKKLPGA